MKDSTSGSAAERYDYALSRARHTHLLPGYSPPKPTAAWPEENVALLERYRDWLLSSGARRPVVNVLYLPMAGHALGLNIKPHAQLDLDSDLAKALDYVKAKQLSAEWTDMCRNALAKFRLFLHQQRGLYQVVLRPVNPERYHVSLPDWVIEQLTRYQHLRQVNWRPARVNENIMRFWGGHTRLWRWLCEHYDVYNLSDIRRQYVLDYVDHRLTAGYSARGINQDLRYFRAFLLYLQDQEFRVPQALLRVPILKEPDRLPRFLTDDQVRFLRDDLERRVVQARFPAQKRDALLDSAAFYLLWQGGLRLGEVEELRQEDLDLPGRKLTVHQGKGRKDRTVYLTDKAVQALEAYLEVRGMGPTDHVFFYRNLPLCKDLVRDRVKAAGERAGVKATPHRLRHTFATQLLNAGCRVTSIQKLLGHRHINSTMIYARVHDRTVAEDYYAAMDKIEKQLDPNADRDPVTNVNHAGGPVGPDERARLLALLDRLSEPQLGLDVRLELVEQMRRVLAYADNLGQKTMDTAA